MTEATTKNETITEQELAEIVYGDVPKVEVEEKPKRKKASGNKGKKTKQNPNAVPKPKQEPKPACTWRIETLDENNELVKVLYEEISNKDLLALTSVEKDTGKSRKFLANQEGMKVRMTRISSGKSYTALPDKKKEEPKKKTARKSKASK